MIESTKPAVDATLLAELGHAIGQAHKSAREGGVPIGSALVVDGRVVALGHNQRMQLGSAIRHAEMDCLERAGRLPASYYRRATIYTTHSPCQMCTGTILMYGIPRVVIGESRHFCETEDLMRAAGVEVVVVDDQECFDVLEQFILDQPEVWAEDIGVEVEELVRSRQGS